MMHVPLWFRSILGAFHSTNGTGFSMNNATGALTRGPWQYWSDGKLREPLSFEDGTCDFPRVQCIAVPTLSFTNWVWCALHACAAPNNYILILGVVDTGTPPLNVTFYLNVTVMDVNDPVLCSHLVVCIALPCYSYIFTHRARWLSLCCSRCCGALIMRRFQRSSGTRPGCRGAH